VLEHEVKINASRFTPIDSTFIPTGELRDVRDTPFDFTRTSAIGARIQDEYEQLIFGGGYDHNFVLDQQEGELTLAVEVYEPTTGRVMQILTTEPGLQFYTGNFLEDLKGKGGKIYRKRDGLCLETQHFPDSPNKPNFPSTMLKPGAQYAHTTVYKFSAKRLDETP
jgi:aldose 1-epimerase